MPEKSGSQGNLECVTVCNHASSRCSKISRFACALCPLLQSSITSPIPILTQLSHLTTASNSPRGLGLFLNYSHVPVGSHISSLCCECRLQTSEGGQVTRCKNQVCVLAAAALVTADFNEITPLTLKNYLCVFSALILFSHFSQYIPPLFFLLFFSSEPSFAMVNVFISISFG